VLPSVPRVYEKVHTAVVSAFAEATGARRRLIDWSLRVGREASTLRAAKEPLPAGLKIQHALADRLVYAKVRERLGGRLRTPISGGAPLAREIAEFFDVFGIRIFEGYGLTECTTAATINTPEHCRFGTVGPAFPGFELRLAEDGELLIRSETVFAGYYKDPEATAAVLDADGWLKTGDVAEIDADGFVRITDRKKDILVTAGGKNVAPQNIENDLKTSPLVSQALVVGDRRPYVAALITLEPDEIGKWASANGVEGDMPQLARDRRVRALLQDVVDEANRERSRFEQVRRFLILPRDFSVEQGEITPTMKLRRRAAMQHFEDAIEELYSSDGSAPDDPDAVLK
jgi:long-chain acyl-CoA synthetase